MRLAVMLAMQPLANLIRALAMSSDGEITGAPAASRPIGGASTSDRIRSRSWTMRSRITFTSVPRGLYGAMRTESM